MSQLSKEQVKTQWVNYSLVTQEKFGHLFDSSYTVQDEPIINSLTVTGDGTWFFSNNGSYLKNDILIQSTEPASSSNVYIDTKQQYNYGRYINIIKNGYGSQYIADDGAYKSISASAVSFTPNSNISDTLLHNAINTMFDLYDECEIGTLSVSGDIDISLFPDSKKYIVSHPTSSQNISLPNSLTMNNGGVVFTITNNGIGINNIKSNSGDLIFSQESETTVQIFLIDKSTNKWLVCY